MLSQLLPSPDMYQDWQSFARALITSLDDLANQSASEGDITYISSVTPVSPGQLPALPAGWSPVWLNSVDATAYLANPDYNPPDAGDIVFIDTQNLANAAVEVGKLADGAVTSAKILNATIASADVGNLQVISALIADAAIVTAKINDLAVNNAKIANLAVDSGKIANLAVGTAHIQTAAITQALIGNAQIVTAHIQDGQITNAKIGNTIQSATWNATTKSGWMIDKNGLIQGQGVAIYDTGGNLVFGSGGTVSWSAITGYTPGAAANRVFYSQMELGTYGWAILYNPSGLATSFISGVSGGYDIVRVTATFTAVGQTISLGQSTAGAPAFYSPCRGGERLSVQMQLQSNAPATYTWNVSIYFFDSAGALVGSGTTLYTGTVGTLALSQIQAAFVTVPAGAVNCRVEAYLNSASGATGAYYLSLARLNITGATDNQTAHPPFSPGPNGFVEQLTSGNISTFIASAAIGTALIQDAAIVNAKIADATITSAKIISLDAAKINAASLSAITAVVGLLRTATTGARLEIESNQIRVYDSSNVLRVRMGIW